MRRPTLRAWELILACGLIALLAAVLLPAFGRAREASKRASCPNNLKQLGLVMKMYAGESRGERWPALSRIPGNWFFDMPAIYPEYLTDPTILMCPEAPAYTRDDFALKRTFDHPGATPGQFHPDCAWHASYVYTGFTVRSDEQAVALFEASLRMPWDAFRETDHTLQTPVWQSSINPMDLSGIPVLWDRVPFLEPEFNHRPPGINVLHMSGGVAFARYHPNNASTNFPATHLSAATFGSTPPRRSPDCYAWP